MGRPVEVPIALDNEENERHQQAKDEPVVHQLQVGCLGNGVSNALVEGVHDQEDCQRERHCHLLPGFSVEQCHLDDGQEAHGGQVGVGNVVGDFATKVKVDAYVRAIQLYETRTK